MPSVTIDSSVLAVPPLISTSEDAYNYVETIIDWRRLLDEPWIFIYMVERASEILFEAGLYPIRAQLKKLFSEHGIEEYDVNTVARVVDTLLQITPHFETRFGLNDVLVEDVHTDPMFLGLVPDELVKTDLIRCIVLLAILRDHCSEPVKDHSLVLRRAPNCEAKVSALIHELEHERQDVIQIAMYPEVFRGTILLCSDFCGLIESLDEGEILRCAEDAIGLETAIQVALYKSRLLRGVQPDWDDVGALRIGDRFYDSVMQCCRDAASSFVERLLRAIVEAIDGQHLAAVHALRKGQGGNDPQRMRDQDKAMRRDVDHEYHLHYWQCEDGTVELATVGIHNDFSIPE